MTIDHPQIRSRGTCPLCIGRKDKGLLTCWACYRRHDLRNGNASIAAKIDRIEGELAALVVETASRNFDAARQTDTIAALISLAPYYLIERVGADATRFDCKKCKGAWRIPSDKLATFNALELFDHAYLHSSEH